jgi:hypothetical protein
VKVGISVRAAAVHGLSHVPDTTLAHVVRMDKIARSLVAISSASSGNLRSAAMTVRVGVGVREE